MVISPLRQRARLARAWLLDACFPLWAEQGVGEGGFREALDLQHNPIVAKTARVRVQARQTFVFAAAKQLGWTPGRADALIGFGLETLDTACRTSDGLFARILDFEARQPVSQEVDLYDTAFALLAMAAAHAGGFQTGARINATLAALERHMAAPSGGYDEMLPRGPYRLQNPHMHLFEACLEAFAATGDQGHLTRAGGLAQLCLERFIDPETGTLGEAFIPSDWSIPDGEAGEIVEPGHQFEWVWLFERYVRLSGTELPPQAHRLYAFACETLEETGRAVQSVTRRGIPHDTSARTWPQTEALKAHLTMMRAGDEAAAERAARSFDLLMDTYLTGQGGWRDHFAADGTLLATTMPASTGYHVIVAFLDLIETVGT